MEKENSELKPAKLRLKIDIVSYPARAEGLGKYGNPKAHGAAGSVRRCAWQFLLLQRAQSSISAIHALKATPARGNAFWARRLARKISEFVG